MVIVNFVTCFYKIIHQLPKYQLDESIHVAGVNGLLVLEKAFVVAVRRDTQVICRFDAVVANLVSQEQE